MQTDFENLPTTIILAPIVCFSKKRLFEEVAECASHIVNGNTNVVIQALNDREKLGSTVFAKGIALPHALLPNAKKSFAILSLLDEPIPFYTIDTNANSIDIAYSFFLSKNDNYEEMQNKLIKICDIFSNSALLTSLRLSRYDENKIYNILKKVDLLLSDDHKEEHIEE